MKKILLAILPLLAASYSFGQNNFPSSGLVSIGTYTPLAPLDVHGVTRLNSISSNIDFSQYSLNLANSGQMLMGWNRSGSLGEADFIANQGLGSIGGFAFYNYDNSNRETQLMSILGNGNVGIGTTSPWKKLQIVGALSATTTDFNPNGTGSSIILGQNANIGNSYSFVQASINGSNSAGPLSLNPNGGAVGIGTTSPDKTLTVKGTIHASEVLVDSNIPTPDYVFDKDYDLATLKDVKTYIDKNRHLPEIPSAAEVAKDGINLGEMNARLLKKIEELTLYLIEKDEQLKEQEATNLQQEKRLRKIEKQIQPKQ